MRRDYELCQGRHDVEHFGNAIGRGVLRLSHSISVVFGHSL